MIQQIDRRDLFRGCLLGLAVGDALGASALGRKATDEPIREPAGGGLYELEPGEWTDETSTAMCLSESLLGCRGFDTEDQLARYRRWLDEGYWSCRDFAFGVDACLRSCLRGTPRPVSNAGAVARTAPVALYFLNDPETAIIHAGENAQLTHPGQGSLEGACHLAGLLIGALRGESRETLLQPAYSPLPGYWQKHTPGSGLAKILRGSYQGSPAFLLKAEANPTTALEIALWAFASNKDFKSGALAAANIGGPCDTICAIYGQLAGAYYGASHMPDNWLRTLSHREHIEALADELWEASVRR